jgi:large subunit ribosomal protein L10
MRPEKEAMVGEIHQRLQTSRAVFVAEYVGLKSCEMEELRSLLKPMDSDCMVVKNRLLSRAISQAKLPGIDEHLKGSTAVIFGRGDDAALAKRVQEFSKEHNPLKIKVGILEKILLSREDFVQLASLPSREVLLAQVVGTLMAPITSFVRVLNALPQGLVVALNAIRQKKEEAGMGSPPS